MANHPTTVIFEEHNVRVVDRDGEPWFVAADVCAVLDLDNNPSRVIESLDESEKGIRKLYTLGGEQEMLIIDKSGLYALIFRSRKPNAVAFRMWVTRELIPSIEQTGKYAVDPYYRDWNGQIDRYDRGNMGIALGFIGVTLASDGRAHPGRGRRREYVLNWRGNACLPLTKEIRKELLAEMAAKLLYHPSRFIVKDAIEILLDRNCYDPTTRQLFVDGKPAGGQLFRFIPKDHYKRLANQRTPVPA